MKKRILVINPNTSESVTDKVLGFCRQLHGDVQWDGVTSRLGARYISSEVAYAVASHAVLEAYADHYDGHDAVFLACFGDPGLLALREMAAAPVIGLAQASFVAAAARGRFGVVTGGLAWEPMLRRFARAHQLADQLVGIHTVALSGAEIAAAPERAIDMLDQAGRRAVNDGATVILLGGAALAGMAPDLQRRLPVPVLDNVGLAAAAVVIAAGQPRSVVSFNRSGTPMEGVGSKLSALLQNS